MPTRKLKKNYITRKGRKLYGAAMGKVLEAEKNRSKRRNGKRRKNFGISDIASLADAARSLAKNRRRNVEGYMADGVFHPIRGSNDYSPKAAGEVKAKYKTAKRKTARKTATLKGFAGRKQGSKAQSRRGTVQHKRKRNLASLVLVNGRRGKKRNGLYETFHGRPSSEDIELVGPDGMPGRPDVLGELDMIRYRGVDGSVDLKFDEGVYLVANKAGNRYWIAYDPRCIVKYKETNSILGPATRLEYTAWKDHIPDSQPGHFYHKLGEETGEQPTLCIDHDGLLVLEGGAYETRSEGIVN